VRFKLRGKKGQTLFEFRILQNLQRAAETADSSRNHRRFTAVSGLLHIVSNLKVRL
jgi:hypothetical protein